MDEAARYGHLDVVRFHHERRTEGCTTQAMDEAAHGGHLDVVCFLHEHRSEGCTILAMNDACIQWGVCAKELRKVSSEADADRHHDTLVKLTRWSNIALFLGLHCTEACPVRAMESACKGGC
ncbi:hypothetical protein BDK51DRAFT_41565 [Blyttiomyces helicus]|uniref:Ankyrin repeat-containing domain protein n=1 Tax=Blyttiomyces helicus TaxID=388810 RepID=A0A4P9WJZ5_9FUNG|nr:hypothetical protein BDK51DRAFT_41565 [Blyttiomyces helicus]|eukprot:RKO92395.1 hypothetical protein BDK51DRAFT_41565 [Blyttiomyces helicus]